MKNNNTELENRSINYIPSVPCEFVCLVVFKTNIAISRILCDQDIESEENVNSRLKEHRVGTEIDYLNRFDIRYDFPNS